MRTSFNDSREPFLKYQIREIVEVAKKVQKLDPTLSLSWENIGDPIAKGWTFPPFAKEILVEEIRREGDKVFGYAHSWGKEETREWVVNYAKRFCPNTSLQSSEVVFTNGLGAAISILYQMLPEGVRILQPTPSYPTHVSLESFRAESGPILYSLDPQKNWEPDVEEMEAQIVAHPEVGGILVINPNNPTGAVHTRETLQKIVALAEKYQLFIISDEVYFRLVYNNHVFTHLTELCEDKVPLIVMRGASKDIPWPGSRSGWLEFHGIELDSDYRKYVETIKKRILFEVCSTTLPQTVIPKIYDHPEFESWLLSTNRELGDNARTISDLLSQEKYLYTNNTNGAFYMMPIFREGLLTANQTLPIQGDSLRHYIEGEVGKSGVSLDQRFTYYLLASTGICIVPATGFYARHAGFRLTTLDRNPERRENTYRALGEAIRAYLSS